MSKEAGRAFGSIIKLVVKLIWKVFIFSLHLGSRFLELIFGVIAGYTKKHLN